MLIRPTVASLLLLPALAACASDAEPAPAAGGTSCSYPTDPAGAAKKAKAPEETPTETGKPELTITTDAGAIPITLDADAAPCTVNSFVSLARQGYFDETPCHRLVPGFVLQCGDPSGTGSGGPGYSFEDELTGKETYPRGTLAMANAGPNTNGSQFFIVTADAKGMPPNYTVFGTVSPAGMKVVESIEAKGTDGGVQDGAPAEKVVIDSVK